MKNKIKQIKKNKRKIFTTMILLLAGTALLLSTMAPLLLYAF
jgi:hypothetical protein